MPHSQNLHAATYYTRRAIYCFSSQQMRLKIECYEHVTPMKLEDRRPTLYCEPHLRLCQDEYKTHCWAHMMCSYYASNFAYHWYISLRCWTMMQAIERLSPTQLTLFGAGGTRSAAFKYVILFYWFTTTQTPKIHISANYDLRRIWSMSRNYCTHISRTFSDALFHFNCLYTYWCNRHKCTLFCSNLLALA